MENASQNYNEVSPQTYWNRNQKRKKQKQKAKSQVLVRMRRKGNPCALLLGMQIGTGTMGNSMAVPQKIENRTTVWSSNSTLKTLTQNDMCFPFHCGIIPNSQDVDTVLSAQWGMNEWRKCNIYT